MSKGPLKKDADKYVVEFGSRDWGALVQERTGSVNHDRIHKKDLDDSVQADCLRFLRWNPDSVLVQIREKTKGETMLMSNVRMPVKQFLILAKSFIASLPK